MFLGGQIGEYSYSITQYTHNDPDPNKALSSKLLGLWSASKYCANSFRLAVGLHYGPKSADILNALEAYRSRFIKSVIEDEFSNALGRLSDLLHYNFHTTEDFQKFSSPLDAPPSNWTHSANKTAEMLNS